MNEIYLEADLVTQLFGYMVQLTYVKSLVLLVSVISNLLVFYLAFPAIYSVFGVAVGCVSYLYPDKPRAGIRAKRVRRVLSRRFNRYVPWIYAIFIALWAPIRLHQNPKEDSQDAAAQFVTLAMLSGVVLAMGCYWFFLLKIRSSRKRSPSALIFFDKYLFGQSSMTRRFRDIVGFLIGSSLFFTALVPGTVSLTKYIGNRGVTWIISNGEYDKGRQYLIECSGNARSYDMVRRVLPSTAGLEEHFNFFYEYESMTKSEKPWARARQGMFLAVSLLAAIQIGMSSVLGVYFYKGRKRAVIGLLFATIKSSLIVAGLGLVVSKGYLVDTSPVFGGATVFFFIISYFLMVETVPDQSIEENSWESVDNGIST